MLFRASASDAQTGRFRRWVRMGLRLGGAALLFFIVVKAWGAWRDRDRGGEENPPSPQATAAVNNSDIDFDLSPGDMLALAAPLMKIRQAEDSTQVANAATTIFEKVKSGGVTNSQLYNLRNELVEIMEENADSNEIAALDAAVAKVAGPIPNLTTPEPIVRAYLGAVERNDSTAMKAYHDSIRAAFAGERITELEQKAERQDERADSLEDQLEEARESRGLRGFISGAADDLGVGFGWSAVYFTAFLALWRGKHPASARRACEC